MRLTYYRFPEGTPEDVLLSNGCGVILKTGDEFFPSPAVIPDDKRPLVDCVNTVISGVSITTARKLMKQYGGCGWTAHIDRDGCVFETTPIQLKGNNSRHKYNRHL